MSLGTKDSGGATVLVVEDEAVARRALVSLLTSTGYHAVGAASGEEALKLIKKERKPAIVLVDLNLPGIDGLELIDEIRKEDCGVFPVLITAAIAGEVTPRAAAKKVRYLPKPLDYSTLIAVLSENVPAN